MRKRGGRRNEWTNEWDARNEWIDQRAEWLNRFIWQIRLADRDCLFILFYFILFCFILFCYVFASNLVVESNIFEPVCTSTFFFSPSFFLTKHISRIYIYIYTSLSLRRTCACVLRIVYRVWLIRMCALLCILVCVYTRVSVCICMYVCVCMCVWAVCDERHLGRPACLARAEPPNSLELFASSTKKTREGTSLIH